MASPRKVSIQLSLLLLLTSFLMFGVLYYVNKELSDHFKTEVDNTVQHLSRHALHSSHLVRLTQLMTRSVNETILNRRFLKDFGDHHHLSTKEKKRRWAKTIHTSFHDNYNEAVSATKKMLSPKLQFEDQELLKLHLENLKSYQTIGHELMLNAETLSLNELELGLTKLRQISYQLDNGISLHYDNHIKEFEGSKKGLNKAHLTVSGYLAFSYAIAALAVFFAVIILINVYYKGTY